MNKNVLTTPQAEESHTKTLYRGVENEENKIHPLQSPLEAPP